jgi:hypothetical protein
VVVVVELLPFTASSSSSSSTSTAATAAWRLVTVARARFLGRLFAAGAVVRAVVRSTAVGGGAGRVEQGHDGVRGVVGVGKPHGQRGGIVVQWEHHQHAAPLFRFTGGRSSGGGRGSSFFGRQPFRACRVRHGHRCNGCTAEPEAARKVRRGEEGDQRLDVG